MLLLATILTTGLLIALDVASFAIEDIDTLQTDAPSAILFDARRGQVLYSKASDEHIHSPLVNRLVTALIVLEKADTEALIITGKVVPMVKAETLNCMEGKNMLSRIFLMHP